MGVLSSTGIRTVQVRQGPLVVHTMQYSLSAAVVDSLEEKPLHKMRLYPLVGLMSCATHSSSLLSCAYSTALLLSPVSAGDEALPESGVRLSENPRHKTTDLGVCLAGMQATCMLAALRVDIQGCSITCMILSSTCKAGLFKQMLHW